MGDEEIVSGTIRMKIENLDKWTEDQRQDSAPTIVAGIPWKLVATSKNCDMSGYVRHLAVYIFCNETSEMEHRWSVDYKRTFSLIAQDGSAQAHTHEDTHTSDDNNCGTAWGQTKFISWADLINESNPWVRNNSTEVEVRIVVTKLEGIDYPLHVSFSSSTVMHTDVVLLVGAHRLHVNKAYLAMHSSVFEDMFFGELADQSLNEVTIKDVDYNEFHTFLCVIYPTRRRIDDNNVKAILKLANLYDVKNLVRDCEQFIQMRSALAKEKERRLAEKCNLSDFLDCCAKLYSTVKELEALTPSDEGADLSNEAKAALFERCLEVVKK